MEKFLNMAFSPWRAYTNKNAPHYHREYFVGYVNYLDRGKVPTVGVLDKIMEITTTRVDYTSFYRRIHRASKEDPNLWENLLVGSLKSLQDMPDPDQEHQKLLRSMKLDGTQLAVEVNIPTIPR